MESRWRETKEEGIGRRDRGKIWEARTLQSPPSILVNGQRLYVYPLTVTQICNRDKRKIFLMTSFITKLDYNHKLLLEKKTQDISLLQTANIWKQQILLKRDEKEKHWGLAADSLYINIKVAMFLHVLTVKRSKMFHCSWGWKQQRCNNTFILSWEIFVLCDT